MDIRNFIVGDFYILTRDANGCDVQYLQIREISDVVKRYYHFSAPEFWMWKMFQFGYVYGKRAERSKRKAVQWHEGLLPEADN